ncbi:hypothetical protein A1Q1_06189 [Trichosporon asahii var. asahii CBS 2479]|uniref:Uncharacterized protein n=1 Tax=Trichosporon asahii var. asahii (strain ATCC 90039 / CBS 2479 / JCM 2466 / KCTC 7840 / NBRC 103889/ NCYC 2677 / UAMH 7654) TaxID=1186058 RepID=J5SFR5_TRIAS|nr:hypothetical protein A1Q1_06189 [Trichosporon asahii var. asahii CBS 2479]EJT45426.1 hypothetical protein A1Q1_06189 [Trichosporon asahii var. asahii CBS 2479]
MIALPVRVSLHLTLSPTLYRRTPAHRSSSPCQSVLSAIWWRGGVGCRQDAGWVAEGAAPIAPIRRIRPTQKYPAAQESGELHRSVAQRYSGVAHYLASKRPRSALLTCLMRDSSLLPPGNMGTRRAQIRPCVRSALLACFVVPALGSPSRVPHLPSTTPPSLSTRGLPESTPADGADYISDSAFLL